ncbi:MAG: PD-(D/E)XK nuclease family protein, partial [Ruminococcus sp.]|nr:PD-(D/E)XK nuclease family protein [Ruminococcus sp.]
IIASPNVMREERFTVKINANLIDDTLEGKAAETKVVMQGAVDLLFEENGKLVLVDYKTDRVKEVQRLRTLYSKQLELYKNAVEQSTEMQVSTCIIYSIHRNEFVVI